LRLLLASVKLNALDAQLLQVPVLLVCTAVHAPTTHTFAAAVVYLHTMFYHTHQHAYLLFLQLLLNVP
jgi:hypothetical protein